MDRRRLERKLSTSLLVVILIVLAGCSGEETDFESATSPDGQYVLIVTVTEPAMPHARHKVAAYIKRAGESNRRKLIETKLANDGVAFTSRNIGLRWTTHNKALVCLRPTDLADRGIHINVAGTPSAEIKPGC